MDKKNLKEFITNKRTVGILFFLIIIIAFVLGFSLLNVDQDENLDFNLECEETIFIDKDTVACASIFENDNIEKPNFLESEKECVLWFDGCNYCEITFDGSLICTEIDCKREEYADPFCKAFLTEDDYSEKIIVGYCPTMKEDVIEFSNKNENVVLKEFQSSGDVLLALENDVINLAIIGRRAKSFEGNNFIEEIKESGFTIVFSQKVLIQTSDLNLIPLHTHHTNYPRKYFSEDKVFLHSNLSETISNAFANDEPALITWEEFNDELELVVVMQGQIKNKDFRGVFFYKKE
jgi:hypothetical protein